MEKEKEMDMDMDVDTDKDMNMDMDIDIDMDMVLRRLVSLSYKDVCKKLSNPNRNRVELACVMLQQHQNSEFRTWKPLNTA
jgi:hypothetical protein